MNLKDVLAQLSTPKRDWALSYLTTALRNIEVVSFSCQIVTEEDKKLSLNKVLLAVNVEMDVYHQIDTHVIVTYRAKKFIKHPKIEDEKG